MPIYEYTADDKKKSCDYCKIKFEIKQSISDEALKKCPKCGNKVRKVFSPFGMGHSATSLDRNAKEKGFHKLKKVDKGKYEKLY